MPVGLVVTGIPPPPPWPPPPPQPATARMRPNVSRVVRAMRPSFFAGPPPAATRELRACRAVDGGRLEGVSRRPSHFQLDPTALSGSIRQMSVVEPDQDPG